MSAAVLSFRPHLLRRRHLSLLVEAMDAVQDVLGRKEVLAAAGRFFERPFADGEALALHLRQRDAHSQFYPWLLWDAELRGGRLGRKLLRKRTAASRDDALLVEALTASGPDVFQIIAIGGGATWLERIADGAQLRVTEPVLEAVAATGDLLVGRVLALDACSLLDAVHVVLPADARRGMVRAARRARSHLKEARLPMLMTAAYRALARLERPTQRLRAPDGSPVVRATLAFDIPVGFDLDAELAKLCRDGVLARDPNGDLRVIDPALGALGARLYRRSQRLHAATRSVARAERLRVSLGARLPGLRPRLTVVCDVSALHAEEFAFYDENADVARMTKDWVDEYLHDLGDRPLLSLGGATPREAVRTNLGRNRVKALLRSLEPLTEVAGPDCRRALDRFWLSLGAEGQQSVPGSL